MKFAYLPSLLFLFLLPSIIQGQSTDTKKNTVYVEAFGSGLYYSVNYDRIIIENEKSFGGLSIGIAALPLKDRTSVMLPLSLYGLSSLSADNPHFFEYGAGFSTLHERDNKYIDDRHGGRIKSAETVLFFVPKIGYRFQQAKGGFFARITLSPLVQVFYHLTVKGDNWTDGSSVEYSHTSTFGKEFNNYHIYPTGGLSLGWTF